MFREQLIGILLEGPMTVTELASQTDVSPGEIAEDLAHLRRSLKRSNYCFKVTPAHCRKCGFTFREDKLRKPGKCPVCHGEWIMEPCVSVERRG